jgi:hypothetical protein
MARTVADGGGSSPDWRIPAIRSGLEVTLLLLIVAYLYLHVGSTLIKGLFLVVGLAGSVGILMWYINRLSLSWVQYARSLSRQERRKRARQRRQQRRERSERSDGDQ